MQNDGSNGQEPALSWQTLWQSRTFRIVIYVFCAANAATVVKMADEECCAPNATLGFPFPVYAIDSATLYVTGLLLDVATMLTLAVCGAWLARLLRGANG